MTPTFDLATARGERGMSLVEALIAMALLLLVAIGILPLFTRAMVNNAAGAESTLAANHARHRLEELGQLPITNIALEVSTGNQLLTQDQYFSGQNARGDEEWDAAGAGTGFETWLRTTRVRQFRLLDPPGAIDADLDGVVDGIGGLEDADEDGEFDNPLGPTTDLSSIHIREISVELVSPRDDPSGARGAGVLGAAPAYRVRELKQF
jgi:type II secretory pathway pseudopilin PulG